MKPTHLRQLCYIALTLFIYGGLCGVLVRGTASIVATALLVIMCILFAIITTWMAIIDHPENDHYEEDESLLDLYKKMKIQNQNNTSKVNHDTKP